MKSIIALSLAFMLVGCVNSRIENQTRGTISASYYSKGSSCYFEVLNKDFFFANTPDGLEAKSNSMLISVSRQIIAHVAFVRTTWPTKAGHKVFLHKLIQRSAVFDGMPLIKIDGCFAPGVFINSKSDQLAYVQLLDDDKRVLSQCEVVINASEAKFPLGVHVDGISKSFDVILASQIEQ